MGDPEQVVRSVMQEVNAVREETEAQREEEGTSRAQESLELCCVCVNFVRCWDECCECDLPVCIDCSELVYVSRSRGGERLCCTECFEELPVYESSDDDDEGWLGRKPLCELSASVDNCVRAPWQ